MIKKSIILILLLALVLAVNMAVMSKALADEGEMEEMLDEEDPNVVTDIVIRGNHRVDTEEIMEVVSIEVGDELDGDVLRKDMQNIFDLGWFYDVRVDFEPYERGLRVIYRVVENYQVEEVVFTGVESLDEHLLKEQLTLELGEVLNLKMLDEDLRAIEKKFDEHGYILAKVRNVSFDPETKVLKIEINEGTFGEVTVEGNEKTKDYVIYREIDIAEGEIFNVDRVQKTLRDIYALGFFSENIEPRLQVDPRENSADLIIKVEEVDTGSLNAGGGYSTKDRWFIYVDVEERNLFGRGQEIGFKGEFGRNRTYEFRFYEPHLVHTPYSLGLNIYRYITHEDKEEDNYEYRTREVRQGGNVTIGRPITDTIRLSTRFRLDHTDLSLDRGTAPDDFDPYRGQTRSIALTATRDTRVDPYDPREGALDTTSVELAGYILGGDYDFTKFNLDLRRYFPGLEEDQSWAFRLKGGTIITGDILPPHERYRLGGPDTVRGFGFGTLNGDHMMLFNAEYRFKIYGIFDGALFFDTGSAWKKHETLTTGDFLTSAGAGVRMNTPLGQLRLDLGITQDGVMPHFSIGQTF